MYPSVDAHDGGTMQKVRALHNHHDPPASVWELMKTVLHETVQDNDSFSHTFTAPPMTMPIMHPISSSLNNDLYAALHPSLATHNFTTTTTTTTASTMAVFESIINDSDYETHVPDSGGSGLFENVSCSGLNTFMPALPWIRITFGLLIIAENSLSLAALLRVKRMQMAIHAFIRSMAVAELLMGVWCTYRYGADISLMEDGVNWECRLRFMGNTYLNFVAILSVVGLCLDRCLALYVPFLYAEIVTRRRLRVVLGVIWVLPVFLVCAAYVDTAPDDRTLSCSFVHLASQRTYIVLTVSRCVMIFAIVAAELYIFRSARCQIIKIHPKLFVSSRNSSRYLRMNAKAAITTLAVVVPFLVLYFPVLLVQGHLAVVSHEDGDCMSQALSLVWLIASAHGLLTPVVFCWRFKDVRLNLLSILFCWTRDFRLSGSTYSVRTPALHRQHRLNQNEQRQYPLEHSRNTVSDPGDNRPVVFQIPRENDPDSVYTV